MNPAGSEVVTSVEAFREWVARFDSLLTGHEIVLLSGPLGAGKTEFVKALAVLHGFHQVQSPTFALHHSIQAGSWMLDHFDLYRLESVDDLESTGFWDILQSPSLVLVEWPERVPKEFWPRDRVVYLVTIEKLTESSRRIAWK